MSEWMIGGLVVYGAAVLGLLLGAGLSYTTFIAPEVKRKAARLMFLAPIWPVMVAVLAVRGFRPAWRDADWKGER